MKKQRLILKILLLFIIAFMLTVNIPGVEAKDSLKNTIRNDIEKIINWKKSSIGVTEDEPLLNSTFLNNAGDATGDWYPVGIGRIGYPDDYDAYLAVISDKVSQRYREKNKLSESKATEWHRISLAILAMGGDPTKVGLDKNGEPINLIEDGTYNRGISAPLGLQGINGLTWGLITLDSLIYKIPEDAIDNRHDIIVEIIKRQLNDGGFALNGEIADTDITGMVIQALAPYYNSEQIYTYEQINTGEKVSKSVREVIDEAIQTLSEIQLENGAFASWGIENAESIVQVIVALTELGIDPLTDDRFIKNGNTVLDALKRFQMEDGGFIHSKVVDPDNPSSSPDESNSMASEQTLYALVSLYRLYNENRTLYDFREEMDKALKDKVDLVKKEIDQLPKKISEDDMQKTKKIFKLYKEIPVSERRYVFNYYKLADAMKKLNIKNDSEFLGEFIGEVESGNGAITPLFTNEFYHGPIIFTDEDVEQVESLPENLTTEYYVEVIKLIDKLESAENKDKFKHFINVLQDKKKKIEEINEEIESLNKDIMENLFPFDQLSSKDRKKIENVISRYEKLGDFDKEKIVNYEDVERAKAQVDSLVRTKVVSIGIGVALVIFAVVFILRRKKKKREKLNDIMEQVD